jgi:glycosyltransferase involved in cell wall biosynthesis
MRIVLLMWPDTFEDWYEPLEVERSSYLNGYEGEWTITVTGRLVAAGAEVHVMHATLGAAGADLQRPSLALTHFVPASPLYRAFRRLVWGHRWWKRAARLWPAAPLFSTLSPRLLARVLRLRPDVVVIQDYESTRFDVAAPILRAAGSRIVGLDTGGSARPSEMPWKRWTLGRAHRLLAVHRAEAQRLRSKYGHPDVAVWPAPVRTDVYQPRDRDEARARLGVPSDARLVLSVGRLHPVKGLDDLVGACRELDCELVLAGSGSESGRLAALEGSPLRLLGHRSADELVDWYAAADVFALASRQEGQPVAVLEAMACERAVVATAVGGVPDVVEEGRTGWLVPPRDVERLRAALAEALEDRSRADEMGSNGRERVLAQHSLEIAGERMLRLLDVR